ncbi:MAG: cysteine desulfuration protein SufE [Verrucomicrobiales bacterium]|jgi:cysteine desulfuration protein SufE
MSLAEKQQQLIDDFSLIEDRMERFSAVVERKNPLPPVEESEQIDANRVAGCVSMVWLLGECQDGVCRFRVDADSSIVLGVAVLLCELFSGAEATEIAGFEPTLLENLKISDQLSPTRRRGVGNISARIREIAANLA